MEDGIQGKGGLAGKGRLARALGADPGVAGILLQAL